MINIKHLLPHVTSALLNLSRTSCFQAPLFRKISSGSALDQRLLRYPYGWRIRYGGRDKSFSELLGPLAIEQQLEQRGWESAALLSRARNAIDMLVVARLGGDCWAPDPGAGSLGLQERSMALVVAHDRRDLSPLGWRHNEASWLRMMEAVRAEYNDNEILVYAPPGPGSTPLRALVVTEASRRRWRVIDWPLNPWTLLDVAESVFTLGHEIGLLALLRRQNVRCFSRPFYAGWGLSIDDSSVAPRAFRRGVEEIFAAASALETTWIDPCTQRPHSFEEACAQLENWRRINEENRKIAVCIGMSFWKRRRMMDFLRSTGHRPVFRRTVRGAIEVARTRGGAIAVWAAREPPGLAEAAGAAQVPIKRIEDGFLRSVGLGSDFTPAASIVVDKRGIYYDPVSSSGLEDILAYTEFDPVLLRRARRLMESLSTRGITKYNTGVPLVDLGAPSGSCRLFVPGQVEDDRSMILGGAGIVGNLELLARVRALNPNAHIIYKPHPDVDAGHRRGAITDSEAGQFANRIVRGVSSASIIEAVDEVHTLSSLAGFEALLRGRRVVAYGQPFYAGWGLTTDLAPPPRRQRPLSIEELVAGVLILYPRYLDPVTRLPCGPELIIDRLANPELWRPGPLIFLRRLQGMMVRRFWNHPPNRSIPEPR